MANDYFESRGKSYIKSLVKFEIVLRPGMGLLPVVSDTLLHRHALKPDSSCQFAVDLDGNVLNV